MDETNVESDWASRRKNIYLGAVALFLTATSLYMFWQFWYATPSCFDGFKNGDELGVDCGGSCALVCNASALKPVVRWDPRLFEVSPGVWSVVVYVENPNVNAVAKYAPYTFTIYGEDNQILGKRDGATILPKNKTVGIFEGGIVLGTAKPRRATFEFDDKIMWQKNSEPDPELTITHSPILRLESTPRIEANIKNSDIRDIKNIELVVAVFDGSDNVIATSRTFVEKLDRNDNADVFFTWPKPFELGSRACEKTSDVVLAIDRSGSMASLGKNPPEPLASVKSAASTFVGELKNQDSGGIVSFATDASVDSTLSGDTTSLKSVIEKLHIVAGGVQYTNIADALSKSLNLLLTKNDEASDNQNIIVLLTDGVANKPENPQSSKSETEQVAYAEKIALDAADQAKKSGALIYTIGLGKEIHANFLKTIASSPENFFETPSTSTLAAVYSQISNSICKEVPARIEITYKIFEDLIR